MRQAAAAGLLLLLAAAPGSRADALAEGKQYLRGAPGVPADLERAWARFDSAAQQGNPAAAYYLGLMYRNGLGVPRDSVAAARYLEAAAKGGVPQAMFILSNMLLAGEGVARDAAAARRWIDRADQLEYPEASMAKAIGLRNGSMGYARDEVQAEQQMKVAEHAMRHRPAEP